MPRVPEGQGWDSGKDEKFSVENYFHELKALIPRLPYHAIEAIASVLLRAFSQDRTVFVFGNGGSAAIASHLMCDLNKGSACADAVRRPKVMALTDNVSLVTAWANDCGYEHVFSEQLKSFIRPKDVAFAISTSGDSPNVLLALATAQEYGGVTLGFAGCNGGRMKALCDVCAVVPSDHVQMIEDMHHAMAHSVFNTVRRVLRAGTESAPARAGIFQAS